VSAAPPPQPGDEAPDFTLPDQDGNPVSLSGLRGKSVVLYFYPKADTPGSSNSTSPAFPRS
jgi:peroxiredoxin Q/BCP